MSGKKKYRTANEYLQYLKGDLSNQERHSFERELEADAFEKEAMDGLEMLTPDQAEKDILSLHSRMTKRLNKKRRVTWYRIAASIASLLIIGTVFLQIYDLNPEETEDPMIEEGLLFDSQQGTQGAAEREPAAPAQGTSKGVPIDAEDAEPIRSEQAESSAPETGERTLPEKATPAGQENAAAEPEPAPSEVLVVAPLPEREARISVDQVAEDQVAEDQVAEDQVAEKAEPITHIEAEAVPQKQAARYDHMISEADAAPDEEELGDDESFQRGRKRSEKMAQPTAAQSSELSKKALLKSEVEALDQPGVSGVVLSGEDMRPLPGASVAMKGSKQVVITNKEGAFSLPVQDDSNRTIVADFVGMESQEYKLQDDTDIQLVLQPDPTTLDEVVVMGQGLQTVNLQPDANESLKVAGESSQITTPAQPSAGFDAFKQYVEENILFPDTEKTIDRAVVILLFTVTSTGEIKEVIPLRTPGEMFTEEATRLLQEGPYWTPATTNNVAVDEIVRLRIVFQH